MTRLSLSRARVAAGASILAGVTVALLTSISAPAGADLGPTEPVSVERPSRHRPGHLVSVEALPRELWLPGTGAAYRLQYVSTGVDAGPSLVSGVVFTPEGKAPREGWPVLSWAHGTVGVADVCAPSTAGRSEQDIAYLSAWLENGYAIAATDYVGLGTSGLHPYLDGDTQAYAMIDIVRAANQVDGGLGQRWMALGQSQGAHASMFAASFGRGYAPQLDYRGAIATGMPSQWRTTAAAAAVFVPQAPANPLVIDILAGMTASNPDTFDAAPFLTPKGADFYDRALSEDCFPERAAEMAGLKVADVYAIDADEQEHLLTLLDAEEIPIAAYDAPVFIAQGTEDRVVYPPASATTAELLERAGTDVTFSFYPGEDHNTTLQAAFPDLLAFASRQFAR